MFCVLKNLLTYLFHVFILMLHYCEDVEVLLRTLGIFAYMSRTKLHNLFEKHACAFLLAILSVFFVNVLSAAETGDHPVRKTAIFVENRAGKIFDDKVSVLEDFITSRVTEQGFSVLSREVMTNAIKEYSAEDAKASGVKSERQAPPVSLDKQLSHSSSALRLAQMMGADYIIAASITSFGKEKKAFEGYGVKTVNLIHNLRVSYKTLEAVQGGSLVADTVKVSKTTRFMEGSHTEDRDIINELLDEASLKVAESLSKKRIIPQPAKPELVEITIACGMQDLAQLPVSIPDIRLSKDNTVVIGENKLEVQLLDVTVELNGTVIGSAPGTFRAPPGLSKIRLSREGFNDWVRTINVMAGQKLKVTLQLSDDGYARWKDNTAFLFELKNGEKLTDAVVKVLEGKSQMLKQSGYKVDVHEDVKVDTKGRLESIFNLFH